MFIHVKWFTLVTRIKHDLNLMQLIYIIYTPNVFHSFMQMHI